MHDFDDDDDAGDGADGDTLEALVWQLLGLINPGDEDLALQEFSLWREGSADGDAQLTPVEQVARVIDWRSGFHVDAADTRALVQAVDELTLRWNLAVDWDGDTDDDEFHAAQDVPSLLGVAADRLAERGYTVWCWETADGSYAGWITRSVDDEAMRELATALEINLCLAREVN